MALLNRSVAIISNSFFSIGGAESNTYKLILSMLDKGYEVTLFVTRRDLEKSKPEVLQRLGRVKIEAISDHIFTVSFRNLFSMVKIKRDVSNKLKQFDIVYFSMLNAAISLFPFFRHHNWVVGCRGGDIQNPRKAGYKNIVETSRFPISYKGFRTRIFNEGLLRIFILFGVKNAKFITNSTDMLTEIIELGAKEESSFKVSNALNVKRFQDIISSAMVKNKKYGVTYVLSVGRNDSRKGFYFLIDAAHYFKKNNINTIRFVIKGADFENFRDIALEEGVASYFTIYDLAMNVDFEVGCTHAYDAELPDSRTVALYALADIVVIPSIIEGCPNVGNEAEAANKNLIVANSFGTREFLERKTAVGFPSADGAALAKEILHLLSDQDLQSCLQKNRSIQVAGLDQSHLANRYIEIFENMGSND